MRFRPLVSLCLLLMAGFPLLAAANPCQPIPRIPGTPIKAPHAVFEAYVVEVGAPKASSSVYGIQRTRRALVEVVKSYHGPYGPGQQVETLTIEDMRLCIGALESGSHVMVRSETGGPFEIVTILSKDSAAPVGPIAALARLADEPRRNSRPSLRNAALRGVIDGVLAADLHARARPDRRARCEISRAGDYAQVSWGSAFGGNDARNKVIFERAENRWIEILRYQAPEPVPARNRARKGKQRALWALSQTPAAASADLKS